MSSGSSSTDPNSGILRTPDGFQTASGRLRQQQSLSTTSSRNQRSGSSPSAFDNRRSQGSLPDNVRRPQSSTVQLQQPLFVLKGPHISPEEAVLFKTQAIRVPDTPINEVTTLQTFRLIDTVIKSDIDFMDYDDDFFMRWSEQMSLTDIAEIVMKHFGEKIDMGKTLNQAFNEIPFCYSLDDNYYELNSSQKMDDLLYNYVSAGNEVTAEQERELIISLEKRLEHGNQIKIDYVAARGSNTTLPDDTFMQCKRRIMLVLASARKKLMR